MATANCLNAHSRKTGSSLVHCKNLSTISNVTLFTSTTLHSQPTEPLHVATPQTINYDDQLNDMSRNGDETIGWLPCEAPLMIDDNPDDGPINEVEKKSHLAMDLQRPLKQRKQWFKLSLQASLSAWAIYNTVRYFITFADFGGSTNQAFCLALGTSTGASFLLTFVSFLLAICDSNRLVHSLTPNYLSYIRNTLDFLSSFFLLGPAVVNFTLIFVWKDSLDPHLNFNGRCHLDVDVVWSVSDMLCSGKSPEWVIWVILSALRLALTLIIIIGYHVMLCRGPRHRRAIRGFCTRTSAVSTPEEIVSSSFNHSTLCGTPRSEPSPRNQIRRARSYSSSLSQELSPIKASILGRSTTAEPKNERDPNELVDHFHLIVSQNAQETDQTLDMVHSEHSPSPENKKDILIRDSTSYEGDDVDDTVVGHSLDNGDNIFNLPPVFPVLGYNEFGLPYPPDQNIRVLNGYIRRMPTIESMGSGEVGSSIGAFSNRAIDSIFTSSRPPTRNTLLSRNSTDHGSHNSEPPSRPNSLSARAELFVGLSSVTSSISEHGELLGRTSPVTRRLSTPISYMDYVDTYSSATGGSRGTSSYHTATSGSFLPPGLPVDRRSRSPVWGQRDIILDSDPPP